MGCWVHQMQSTAACLAVCTQVPILSPAQLSSARLSSRPDHPPARSLLQSRPQTPPHQRRASAVPPQNQHPTASAHRQPRPALSSSCGNPAPSGPLGVLLAALAAALAEGEQAAGAARVQLLAGRPAPSGAVAGLRGGYRQRGQKGSGVGCTGWWRRRDWRRQHSPLPSIIRQAANAANELSLEFTGCHDQPAGPGRLSSALSCSTSAAGEPHVPGRREAAAS